MPIGELCNREVIIIRADESIQEAVKLMRQHNVGDLVVVEQRGLNIVPVGVLTDRDLVIEIMAKAVDPQSVTVGDIMSTTLVTALENEELVDVVQRMRKHGVRRVPVVNTHGGLEGIIAVDDVLGLLAEQVNGLAELVRIELHHERTTRSH
jgi:CBS domain-containing protein